MTNPALVDLANLIGKWQMDIYGTSFLADPETHITGPVEVDWIEDGAALVIRQGDSDNPPAAAWIVGRDDSGTNYQVLYSDDRGVSRIYHMSFTSAAWHLWRVTPKLSQRFEAVISRDRRTIRGVWKKSFDGGSNWEHDFNLDYLRMPPPDSDQ
jgi:hypothetical protein